VIQTNGGEKTLKPPLTLENMDPI